MANANATTLVRQKAQQLCSVVNDGLLELEPYELRNLMEACDEAQSSDDWSMRLAVKMLKPEVTTMLRKYT